MKAYTFVAVAKDLLWRPRLARKIFRYEPGLRAVVQDIPRLILVFSTVPHAEKTREKLTKAGVRCGLVIMEADWDKGTEHLQIHGPACGWENVDPDIRARIDADASALREYRNNRRENGDVQGIS